MGVKGAVHYLEQDLEEVEGTGQPAWFAIDAVLTIVRAQRIADAHCDFEAWLRENR